METAQSNKSMLNVSLLKKIGAMHKKRRCGILLHFFFLLLMVCCKTTAGATFFSNGTGGGMYNVPATWAGGVVPTGDTSAVVIVSGDTVTLDKPRTLTGLEIRPSAKFDNNNYLLKLDGVSLKTLYYMVYGEHNIRGNVLYNEFQPGFSMFKMVGPSSGTGGLISGIGELSIHGCWGGDSIVGNFTIPDANIVIGRVTTFIGCGGWPIHIYGTITMTNGSITAGAFASPYNHGSIVMVNGNITLGDVTGYGQGAYFHNYGNILLTNGNLICKYISRFHNEATGVLTIQAGNIDMIGASFYNHGIATITLGYIASPLGSLVTNNRFENFNTLNIGGIGEPIFAGDSIAGLYTYDTINTVNYMGAAGTQQIRQPVKVRGPAGNSYWHLVCSNKGVKAIDGYDLTIRGNLTIKDTAVLDASKDGGTNNYNITLLGNWYDTSTVAQPFIPRDKKVTFSGTNPQTITANLPGGETYYHLTINNSSSGVTQNNNHINVSKTLSLVDGLLHTQSFETKVSNDSLNAVTDYSNASYVDGYLRRNLLLTGGNYAFPVGNNNAFELATVNFTAAHTVANLLVNFSNLPAGTGLPLTDANFYAYTKILNCGGTASGIGNAYDGIWTLSPNAGSAQYNLLLYGKNYDNAATDHTVLKRTDAASPWQLAPGSSYLQATGAEPVKVSRTGFSGFSQFAIGSGGPPFLAGIIAEKDTVCSGTSTTLSAFGGGTYLWSTGETASMITVLPTISSAYNVSVANDTGLVVIVFKSITVNPSPPPVITLSNSSICRGESVTLTASGYANYLWSTGSSAVSIAVNPGITTTYSVTGTDALGCFNSSSKTVSINSITGSAGSDTAICIGTAITLTGTGGINYVWSTGETGSEISVNPPKATIYTLTITDAQGCSSADSVAVYLMEVCCDVFVPNAFSPNSDEYNDVLYVKGRCIQSMRFTIYDRWGNKVFESVDVTNGWDGTYKGKPMDTAVLVYYLQTTNNGNQVNKKGNISLVR